MDQFSSKLEQMERSTDPVERNRIAMELSEVGDLRFKESVLRLLSRKELKNQSATLVNSLNAFDNSDIIGTLVDLVLSGNWEVAHEALLLINNIDYAEGDSVEAAYSRVRQAADTEGEPWRQELISELVELFD